MDNRTKLRLHTICFVSLATAITGFFLPVNQTRADSTAGQPAGSVGWYRQQAQAPASTPSSAPAQPPPAQQPSAATDQAAQAALTQPPPPPNPSNPMLVIDPVNGGKNSTAYYDQNGHLQLGQTTPEEGLQDFRKSPFGEKKEPTALTYFGYDYFKPAQDIIDARRRVLLMGRQPAPGTEAAPGLPQNPTTGTLQQPAFQGTLPAAPAGMLAPGLVPPVAGTTDQTQPVQPFQSNTGSVTGSPAGDIAAAPVTFGNGLAVANLGASTVQPGASPGPPPPSASTPTPAAQTNNAPQDQVDIYAGRVAGPLELMSFLPAGGAVPQTYQLAGGDVLTIRIWSTTMAAQEYVLTVSQGGAVTIPGVGFFVVRGQTIDQAEHALRERVSRMYRGGDISLMLKQQRTMIVTIAGAAYLPGSYLVPASQTAYNVLYAAGGPTIDGSLRSIEVRRSGTLVGTLDIYNFLGVGAKSSDITLQPGDVIYIPNRYSSVAITGEVRKPAIFELTPNETLKNALRFAGGVKASGVTQRVQINTIDPGTARVLRDINIKDADQVASTPLYDGDEVEVFSVRGDVANRVTIEGAVDQVGDYAMAPGMTVADLITRARGTRYNAYTKRADLYRWNDDNTLTLIPINVDKAMSGDPTNNIALTRWDRLKVYGREELTWTAARQVRIRGAVQREGIYYRSDDMHASDLLRMAGGPLPEAYLTRVVLLHQRADGSFGYDYLDANAWAAGDMSNDPLIEDNDILAVYRVDEAHFTADHTVRIDGEVVSPGTYARGEHMKVSDMLKLAGGFTPKAQTTVFVSHPNKGLIGKASHIVPDQVAFDADGVASNDMELHDGDVLTIQGIGGYRSHVRLVYIDGRVNRPGPIPMDSDKMRLSDLIKAAGGLMPDSFVDGAEFHRDPNLLGSSAQQNIAKVVGSLNDLLNDTDYERALAVSDAERIQNIAQATSGDQGLAIPGLGSTTTSAGGGAAAVAAAAAVKTERDPVSPPRKLSDVLLKPEGNIAVDVASAIRHPGGDADVVLDEGDTVTIPTQPTTVEVAGAVFDNRGVVYKPGAGLDYYIAQAGGYAPDAARDRIEIIHPGGGLVPSSKVHRLRAGDMILVPTKVLAAKISTHRNAFDGILKAGLGAAVLLRLLGL